MCILNSSFVVWIFVLIEVFIPCFPFAVMLIWTCEVLWAIFYILMVYFALAFYKIFLKRKKIIFEQKQVFDCFSTKKCFLEQGVAGCFPFRIPCAYHSFRTYYGRLYWKGKILNLTYDVLTHLEGSCKVVNSLHFSSFLTGKKKKNPTAWKSSQNIECVINLHQPLCLYLKWQSCGGYVAEAW